MPPETDTTTETNAGESAPVDAFAAAMAEATTEREGGDGGDSSGDGAGGESGNGAAESQTNSNGQTNAGGDAGEESQRTPGAGGEQSPNWWETEEGRAAHEAELASQAEQRLRDQRTSFQNTLQQARQQEAAEQALTEELEELERVNAAEFANRLKTDPAAAAWAMRRAAEAGANPLDTAKFVVVSEQVQLMRTKLPDLVSAFEALPENEQQHWASPDNGGMFAFAVEHGKSLGAAGAVETYKKSAEHRDALKLAKQEGINETLGRANGSAPEREGAPPASSARIDTGDPFRDAMMESAQEQGKSVDPALIRSTPQRRSA